MPLSIAIVGAGFSGAVVARELAEAGHVVEVFESRDHVAGNCHTRRHETGVMVHVYGPHIFHTQHEEVWNYVQRFGEFQPYRHRVRAMVGDQAYQMPMNLGLINAFFGTQMNSSEAEAFVNSRAGASITNPQSFEEQGLRLVGRELYNAFFAGYTRKQWGVDPQELPASILARLPLRFTADDSYFNHPYQGIPLHGYTPIVEAILDHRIVIWWMFLTRRSFDSSWCNSFCSIFDASIGHIHSVLFLIFFCPFAFVLFYIYQYLGMILVKKEEIPISVKLPQQCLD